MMIGGIMLFDEKDTEKFESMFVMRWIVRPDLLICHSHWLPHLVVGGGVVVVVR